MSSLQGRLPLILSVSFVVFIIAAASLKLWNWVGWNFVIGVFCIAFYLLWLFLESRIAVGETKKQKTSRDRGTLEVYAAARFLTVASALCFPSPYAQFTLSLVLGAVIFIFGVLFRLFAIQTLGKFYSHRVRLTEDHAIVSSGPYGFLRHPAYTGMLLAHLGFVLVFANLAGLIVLFLVFVPAVVARILVEEKALMQISGYAEFASTRRRLVPFIW